MCREPFDQGSVGLRSLGRFGEANQIVGGKEKLNGRIERLRDRAESLVDEQPMLTRVTPITTWRGRPIVTREDLDDALSDAGLEYETRAEQGRRLYPRIVEGFTDEEKHLLMKAVTGFSGRDPGGNLAAFDERGLWLWCPEQQAVIRKALDRLRKLAVYKAVT